MARRHPITARTVVHLIIGLLLFVLPVAAFAQLANEVHAHANNHYDVQLLELIHRLSSTDLTNFMLFLTNFGGPNVAPVATMFVAVLLYLAHRHHAGIVLFVGVAGASVIDLILKPSFHRLRPHLWVQAVHEKTFSFPSGHAVASSALAFSLMYIFWCTRWRWPIVAGGLVYMLLIGFSRLYLGVHYPTDILGGWIVSFAWIMLMREILERSPKWHGVGLTQAS